VRSPAGWATLALLALPCPSTAQPAEVLSPAYQAVVRRYASGDREGAVAQLVAWPEERVRREVPILNRDWQRSGGRALSTEAWQLVPVRAALMLHTDCARREPRGGRPPRLHEIAAWSIARTLKGHAAHRAFARRWYEAFAELAQAEYRWGEALDWAERGLEDFPDSAELLLVRGSIEEMQALQASLAAPPSARDALADPGTQRLRSELVQRGEVRGRLEKARDTLRAALAADASLPEAYLRLGRVAWKLGETAEARSALETALARSAGGRTGFLARLFLGRLHEDAGRLDEATRSYAAALAIEETAQSARVALSHVRLRGGDVASARGQMETAVSFSGLRRNQDPFWLYPLGPAAGVEDRLEALRREASS
jgi:hypothetical protein